MKQTTRARADPRGGGVHAPPPVVSVCNIFCAWLLAFRHTTQLTSKRLVNRIAEGVGITPPLPNPNHNWLSHAATASVTSH